MDVVGSRTSHEDYSKVLASLKRPHLDYFRDVYADTALFGGPATGSPAGSISSAQTGSGSRPIAKTIAAVDRLGLDPAARRKIMVANAERLLNKPLGYSLPVYATAGAASGRPGHFAICVSTISADTTTNSA